LKKHRSSWRTSRRSSLRRLDVQLYTPDDASLAPSYHMSKKGHDPNRNDHFLTIDLIWHPGSAQNSVMSWKECPHIQWQSNRQDRKEKFFKFKSIVSNGRLRLSFQLGWFRPGSPFVWAFRAQFAQSRVPRLPLPLACLRSPIQNPWRLDSDQRRGASFVQVTSACSVILDHQQSPFCG
jgi:hypothetical protein